MSVRSLADTLSGRSATSDVSLQSTSNEGFFSLRTILVGNQTPRTSDPSTRPLLRMPRTSHETVLPTPRLQRPTRVISTRKPVAPNAMSNAMSNTPSGERPTERFVDRSTEGTPEAPFQGFVASTPSNSLFQFKSLESSKADKLVKPEIEAGLTLSASSVPSPRPSPPSHNDESVSTLFNSVSSTPTLPSMTSSAVAASSTLSTFSTPSTPSTPSTVSVSSTPCTPSFLQPVMQSAPPVANKGLELVGGSKRINELTGELAVTKDDLRQAQEQLESTAITIQHHEHTIRTMQAAHQSEHQELNERYKQQYDEKMRLMRSDLEREIRGSLEGEIGEMGERERQSINGMEEERARFETERVQFTQQFESLSSQFDALKSEHAQQTAQLSEMRRAEEDRAQLAKLYEENEKHVQDLRLENDTLKANLERITDEEATWTAEREAMKEAFKTQYTLLEQQLQDARKYLETTSQNSSAAPVSTLPEETSNDLTEGVHDVDDYPIESMRQQISSIKTVFCDLVECTYDQPANSDQENLSIGVCKQAFEARSLHPLRDVTDHNIALHSGGGLHKLDEKQRAVRCSTLDAHIGGAHESIGQETKGPAAHYLHSNMLDISEWIKRQQTERTKTRMVSVGY